MNYKRLSTRNRVKDARQNEDYNYVKQIANELNEWIDGGKEGVTYKEVTDYLGIRDFIPYKHSTANRDYWVLANSSTNAGIMFMHRGDIVYICEFVDDVYRLPAAMVGDSRRVKDEYINNLWYDFGSSFSDPYNIDKELEDEDYDVALHLERMAEEIENKYLPDNKAYNSDIESWKVVFYEIIELLEKTPMENPEAVYDILESDNFHYVYFAMFLIGLCGDKRQQQAIDFLNKYAYQERTTAWYTALAIVGEELGIM